MAAGAKKGGLWERAGRVEARNGVLNVREKKGHSGAFSVFSRDGRHAERGGHRAKKRKMPPAVKRPKKKLSFSAYLYRVVLGAFVIPRAGRNKRVNDRKKKWGPSSFLLLPSFPLLLACGARVFTRGSTSVGPCTQGVYRGGAQ